MCTYLYAGLQSQRRRSKEGPVTTRKPQAVARWRRVIMSIALEEMGHLTAVWNITARHSAAHRASDAATSRLEPRRAARGHRRQARSVRARPRSSTSFTWNDPKNSDEPEGRGLCPRVRPSCAGVSAPASHADGRRLRKLSARFYACLERELARVSSRRTAKSVAFSGDPALQLSQKRKSPLPRRETPVLCSKTALAAVTAIIEQGEGRASVTSTESQLPQVHGHPRRAGRDQKARTRASHRRTPRPTNPVAATPLARRTSRFGSKTKTAAATVDPSPTPATH